MPKGGVTKMKDVMGYQPPLGPKNIADAKGPGLHGSIYKSGLQEASCDAYESGQPGLGGDKVRRKGTQK